MAAPHQQIDAAAKPNTTPQFVAETGHRALIFSVAYSRDGHLVLTAGLDGVCLWDALTGQQILRFEGTSNEARIVALSPDGRFVAAEGKDGKPHIWELNTGKDIQKFNLRLSNIGANIAFSPDGASLLIGGYDKAAYLFDVATGKEIRRFGGHPEQVSSVAFSQEGHFVITGSVDLKVRIWDVKSGKRSKTLTDQSKPDSSSALKPEILSVTFSPNSQLVAAGCNDGFVRVWDVSTGTIIKRIPTISTYQWSIAFSPDGKSLALSGTSSADNLFAWVFNTDTWQKPKELNTHASAFAWSRDGANLLIGTLEGFAELWDVNKGVVQRTFGGMSKNVNVTVFSPDGSYGLLAGNGLQLWNLETADFRELAPWTPDNVYQKQSARIFPRMWYSDKDWNEHFADMYISCAAFAPDNRHLLLGVNDALFVMDISTIGTRRTRPDGREVYPRVDVLEGHKGRVTAVAWSPDGRFLLSGGVDRTVRLWDASTLKEIRRFAVDRAVGDRISVPSLAFSPDSRYILTAGEYRARSAGQRPIAGAACLWEVNTGRQVRSFIGESGPDVATFSPDGKYIVTGTYNGNVEIWNSETGALVRALTGHSGPVKEVVFLSDNVSILSGGGDGQVILWDIRTGQPLKYFSGHRGAITSIAVTPNGRLGLSAGTDNIVHLLDLKQQRALCQIVFLQQRVAAPSESPLYSNRLNTYYGMGDWVVVDSVGRFDMSAFDARGAHWLLPDDPLQPVPMDAFAENYYEPQLLKRILLGEQFGELPDVGQLNHALPRVTIGPVKSDSPHTISVTVTVQESISKTQRDKEGQFLRSEAFDLCLFRDGKLVGYAPRANDSTQTGRREVRSADSWRERTRLHLDQNGKAVFTFTGIQLPPLESRLNSSRRDFSTVDLAAYAFNSDRVKGPTSTYPFRASEHVNQIYQEMAVGAARPSQSRAYILTFGVNVYENATLFPNLIYSVNDARKTQKVLQKALKDTGFYTQVEGVSLISDYNRPNAGEKPATKKNLQTVLSLLAGRTDDNSGNLVPGNRIWRATQDDVVIILLSGHGYLDSTGEFYVIPSDTGTSSNITEALKNCISTRELTEWLSDIDAGEVILVIDSCHSGAVADQNLKPGPIASRGLGKLAYDKGMRVLAATQAPDNAIGSGELQMGLLSYALIEEGVVAGSADTDGDGQISLKEWLSYAATRVPNLYLRDEGALNQDVLGRWLQRPRLVDFAPRVQNPPLSTRAKNTTER